MSTTNPKNAVPTFGRPMLGNNQFRCYPTRINGPEMYVDFTAMNTNSFETSWHNSASLGQKDYFEGTSYEQTNFDFQSNIPAIELIAPIFDICEEDSEVRDWVHEASSSLPWSASHGVETTNAELVITEYESNGGENFLQLPRVYSDEEYSQASAATREISSRRETQKPFLCDVSDCDRRFSSKCSVKRHKNSCHRDLISLPLFSCPVIECQRVGKNGFTRWDNVLQHVRNMHPAEDDRGR